MTPTGARSLAALYETQINELRADIAVMRKYVDVNPLMKDNIAKKEAEIAQLAAKLYELQPKVRAEKAEEREEKDEEEWLDSQTSMF